MGWHRDGAADTGLLDIWHSQNVHQTSSHAVLSVDDENFSEASAQQVSHIRPCGPQGHPGSTRRKNLFKSIKHLIKKNLVSKKVYSRPLGDLGSRLKVPRRCGKLQDTACWERQINKLANISWVSFGHLGSVMPTKASRIHRNDAYYQTEIEHTYTDHM